MIKKDTIVSTTDGRLTLLQWLKKVEDALKNASATAVKGVPQADGKVVFEIDFADGTSIKSDPFELPEKLPDGYAVDEAGNVTIAGALTANNNGTVEVNGKELFLDGRRVRIRSYKEGIWNNVDFEIQSTDGRYITVLRIRKNDIDGKQVRVMAGGSMDVDDELTANTLYIGGRIWRIQQTSDAAGNRLTASAQKTEGIFNDAVTLSHKSKREGGLSLFDTREFSASDYFDKDLGGLDIKVLPITFDDAERGHILNGLFRFGRDEKYKGPIFFCGTIQLGDENDPSSYHRYYLKGGIAFMPYSKGDSAASNTLSFCTMNINNKACYIENGDFNKGEGVLVPLNEVLTRRNAHLYVSEARYQHTVHLITYSDTDKQLNVSFTARSSKSTPIHSYQDLHEVFGGRNLTLGGCMKYYAMQSPIYLDLHGGTISADKIYCASTENVGAYQQPTLSSFPNIAFTDDVVPE